MMKKETYVFFIEFKNGSVSTLAGISRRLAKKLYSEFCLNPENRHAKEWGYHIQAV
jgi:hypothetical protein